jgi:hypothetical protein
MLAHTKKVLEYNVGSITINPRFDKLTTSLRTAVENGEGLLDKEATSYDDIFDALRMSLLFRYYSNPSKTTGGYHARIIPWQF